MFDKKDKGFEKLDAKRAGNYRVINDIVAFVQGYTDKEGARIHVVSREEDIAYGILNQDNGKRRLLYVVECKLVLDPQDISNLLELLTSVKNEYEREYGKLPKHEYLD